MAGSNKFQIPVDAYATSADSLMTERANPQQITFTPQQLAYLETVFPEQATGSDAMSDAKVRHHLGQRSVIAHIRDKVRR